MRGQAAKKTVDKRKGARLRHRVRCSGHGAGVQYEWLKDQQGREWFMTAQHAADVFAAHARAMHMEIESKRVIVKRTMTEEVTVLE